MGNLKSRIERLEAKASSLQPPKACSAQTLQWVYDLLRHYNEGTPKPISPFQSFESDNMGEQTLPRSLDTSTRAAKLAGLLALALSRKQIVHIDYEPKSTP